MESPGEFLARNQGVTLRGVIVSYDSHTYTGLLRIDDTDFQVEFHDRRRAFNVPLYHQGDKVEFQVQPKIMDVRIYEPFSAFEDFRWCTNCRKHVRYAEAIERVTDSDYGEGLELFCKTCGRPVLWAEKFTTARADCERGIMNEAEAAEFKDALIHRDKMADFLTRMYPHHKLHRRKP